MITGKVCPEFALTKAKQEKREASVAAIRLENVRLRETDAESVCVEKCRGDSFYAVRCSSMSLFSVKNFGVRMSKASVFICLVLLSGLAVVSGQTESHRPLPNEPLEKYDNPPAPLPLWNIGVSPGMISQHDTFTSYQVNVNANGQNITGDAANEPSIAVDPTNHNKMAIGWRQFNSVTSNFRQGGYGYTINGGLTWTFPGVLENNVFRSDPVLYADDIGRFFYLSLENNPYPTTMWRSVDGGVTFPNPVAGAGGRQTVVRYR